MSEIKVKQRTGAVTDAWQMAFDKGLPPKWVQDVVEFSSALTDSLVLRGGTSLTVGDYAVRRGRHVDVLSEEDFKRNYEVVDGEEDKPTKHSKK
jgi:phosphosulfolactate synthase (CoM biosynthesis protein A)